MRRRQFVAYERGFSVPEGLRRHLVGWGGNVRQCDVMEAATKLAREYWHDKFHAAEEAEEAQKQAQTAQRRRSETLYRTAPDLAAELMDEGISYGGTPRNEDDLAWAEHRLIDLGFQITSEANVKTYTSEHQRFVVYADPRANGEIRFTIYKKPLPKPTRIPRVRPWGLNFFHLKDGWKNDIRGKYESRLDELLKRLLLE